MILRKFSKLFYHPYADWEILPHVAFTYNQSPPPTPGNHSFPFSPSECAPPIFASLIQVAENMHAFFCEWLLSLSTVFLLFVSSHCQLVLQSMGLLSSISCISSYSPLFRKLLPWVRALEAEAQFTVREVLISSFKALVLLRFSLPLGELLLCKDHCISKGGLT